MIADWPRACRGPAWLDPLMVLLNARLHGAMDTDARLRQVADSDPAALTAVLAGVAGFFADAARRPAPPGLPTLRDFQRAQASTALGWLRERLPQ